MYVTRQLPGNRALEPAQATQAPLRGNAAALREIVLRRWRHSAFSLSRGGSPWGWPDEGHFPRGHP